jgi:predicted NAD/FAD-binding protein
VTLNADESIDPRRVLRTFEFDHPVFTVQRDAAQSRHAELLNVNRTSYCGAYWRNGFHEDGVWSALAVVEALRGAPTKTSVGPRASGVEPLAEATA